MPAPRPIRRSLVTGLAALLAAATLLAIHPTTAAAVVTHRYGFRATVDGFSSWYGSYGMGSLGTAWCIDHGSRAPDPAFAYAPADLRAVPTDTRAAMAWVVGAHGQGTDRVTHAAVMLVLHDLMDARYPSGPLDLARLEPSRMAGFDGLGAQVLARARLLKADGLAHRHLRGPLALTITVAPLRSGTTTVTVGVRDARGRPLRDITVGVDAPNGGLQASGGRTAADGTWRTTAHPVVLPLSVRARASVPRLVLDAWAPTTRPAQRVARPVVDVLSATARLAAPPPATTTTSTTTSTTLAPPTTTTTVPTTTTTTVASTTTTVAPTTTTTTTIAAAVTPSSTTSSLGPPPTAAPLPPSTALGTPPPVASLPRTGAEVTALALTAVGLLLLGHAALVTARGCAQDLVAIGHHGPHGRTRRR